MNNKPSSIIKIVKLIGLNNQVTYQTMLRITTWMALGEEENTQVLLCTHKESYKRLCQAAKRVYWER
jgi:hypothetical protein